MRLKDIRRSKRKTFVIIPIAFLLFSCLGYVAYQWAIFPEKDYNFIGCWKEEWDISGVKWAKDLYGPVILQTDWIDSHWWKLQPGNEGRAQLRDVWRKHETHYRLSLLYCLAWLGFISMLLLWLYERNRTKQDDIRDLHI